MNLPVDLPLFAILFYIRFIFLSRLLFIFVIYVIYRLVLLYILPVAQRIRTYDVLCISKAYIVIFQKNRRYPTTPGGTACGRAGLRYTRKQAAVYAGLRCVRRQAAVYAGLRRVQAADIIGYDRRRARRNLRAYVRAQMRARCAGVHTHKFQKPEKRLAAVVPRCAGKCRPRCMTAAGKALCGLTAGEIRRYRRRR